MNYTFASAYLLWDLIFPVKCALFSLLGTAYLLIYRSVITGLVKRLN